MFVRSRTENQFAQSFESVAPVKAGVESHGPEEEQRQVEDENTDQSSLRARSTITLRVDLPTDDGSQTEPERHASVRQTGDQQRNDHRQTALDETRREER